ncbi:hypothetical protein SHTP_0103 [Mycobacterium ulcerans subsp. shinshuense]|uniref:Uncharacterized protein n=1 Tax=Mycobacterium ulcerans subsp. shinshuense TaxID=1124626 RepID=A0A1B4XXH0_MYCUL|nr:hypothetical protein SHTP_0103 [Mycobacterium ulcerans subsp. shinshuense]
MHASQPPSKHPEWQRRLCMDRLLPELVTMDVGQAIVESRGLKDDQKDHRTVGNLRRKRASEVVCTLITSVVPLSPCCGFPTPVAAPSRTIVVAIPRTTP